MREEVAPTASGGDEPPGVKGGERGVGDFRDVERRGGRVKEGQFPAIFIQNEAGVEIVPLIVQLIHEDEEVGVSRDGGPWWEGPVAGQEGGKGGEGVAANVDCS